MGRKSHWVERLTKERGQFHLGYSEKRIGKAELIKKGILDKKTTC